MHTRYIVIITDFWDKLSSILNNQIYATRLDAENALEQADGEPQWRYEVYSLYDVA